VTRANEALTAKGITAFTTPVYSMNVPNEPGSMSLVLKELTDKNISLDFLYAFQYRGISQAILHAQDMDALNACLTAYEHAQLLK
jgi:hypothetical protein